MKLDINTYKPRNHIRIITAASLFDGHDAAINVMRRIIQSTGAEVIHLGHNRSVQEIVDCAIQEDAQAIAITSYQGGHTEFLKYMYDSLNEKDCQHIKIFAGGGGVILPSEIQELHKYGISRIYSPDDGREMGLQGMINDLLEQSDFPTGNNIQLQKELLLKKDIKHIGQLISAVENFPTESLHIRDEISTLKNNTIPVIGITGTGGSGKSSLVDELVRRFLSDFEDKTIAIISVDPSKRRSGGALLGDRIRMNSINNKRVFMRSLATRQANLALSRYVSDTIDIMKAAEFDLIILETSGIGQSDTEITEFSDTSLYVMTPEYGAATQLEKIDMLDFADFIAINKFDKHGALDALRDVKKQYARNHMLFEQDAEIPVFGTVASQFHDQGIVELYIHLMSKVNDLTKGKFTSKLTKEDIQEKTSIIPPKRIRYLSEITDTIRNYNQWVNNQSDLAHQLQGLKLTKDSLISAKVSATTLQDIDNIIHETTLELDPKNQEIIEKWPERIRLFEPDEFSFQVRDKEIKISTKFTSLSGLKINKIALPKYKSEGDILKWVLLENLPGEFPYAAGVFPFKREGEDPTRMFAGEGGPERTNKRFHYVSKGQKAKRLSTAFDSVTLYGQDPDTRPDIYGKIGNAGVSIACLDDAKKLYSGFRLADKMTSVSMTINGPAPILVGYFMNAAIDQECEIYIKENGLAEDVEARIETIYQEKGSKRPKYQGNIPEGNNGLGLMLLGITGDMVLDKQVYNRIKKDTICKVRGTVQADILKEDQAQNTCIYSTDFSLKLMGDVQEYFIQHQINNFYSVSISGYHIAEAGANPISQLAFTLANGFTYVEYYLNRGMDINKFGPNLSFFFSNGLDPEYAVIGRVARIIWAKAMKLKYKANSRAQKLKYHIQTSGRSLHAQEIDFNDIRTTLQALYAIYDNCNSLHTNAYDEAITTPTEESVRRAMAIQLIINHELGEAKNQNPLQGAFIIDELTELVEEAVMAEFDRITDRGGVLGAMETMYQRSKIQEESLFYENKKHNGELPIMGVNTFLSANGSPTIIPQNVMRAEPEEKEYQIKMLEELHKSYGKESEKVLKQLKSTAQQGENIFTELMEATKVCSIGQITNALFGIGGEYRRNM